MCGIQKGQLPVRQWTNYNVICRDGEKVPGQLRSTWTLPGVQLPCNHQNILMPGVTCMTPDSPHGTGYLFVHLHLCKRAHRGSLFVQQKAVGIGSPLIIPVMMSASSIYRTTPPITSAVHSTKVITSQVGGVMIRTHSEPLNLQPHKSRSAPLESSLLFLPRLHIGGSRTMLESRYQKAPCHWLNCRMERHSIVWSLDLKLQPYVDSIII